MRLNLVCRSLLRQERQTFRTFLLLCMSDKIRPPQRCSLTVHDHVTAFFHGQSRMFIFFKKIYTKNQHIASSNSNTLSKVKHHFWASLKGHDVTISCVTCQYRQRDANSTGSIAGLSFAICTLTNAPVCFLVINKVYTMFTPIFIPDKHTRELRIYVNPMSKKLNL